MTEDLKRETIKQWVKAYSDTLYTWALHKTSSVETAEDLVQDTFMAALISFDKFQNKSNPKTYLFSILNNKIIDHYRKKSTIEKIIEPQAIEFTDSLFDSNEKWITNESNHPIWDNEKHLLDNPEFNDLLKFCIGNLPEKWRIAISSKYLAEKSAEEICQDLGLTTTNYWQIVHRAKLLLKKCIEKHWKHE